MNLASKMKLLCGACTLVVAAALSRGALASSIPAIERGVLLNLYNQTNGASWSNNANWAGAAGTECTWFGIVCDSGQNHVVRVQLRYNNLTGALPDLSALNELREFSVGGNALTGGLPPLTLLRNLEVFQAYNNQLSGPIPALTGLTALQVFDVGSNQLSGPIPVLAGLSALNYFDVTSNRLSGPIHALTGLTSLHNFNIGINQLSGSIPSLDGLPALGTFYASDNQLTWTIPSFVGLANLNTFYVADNRLSGAIPDLRGLSTLSSFDVEFNQLSGSLPSLEGLSGLRDIRVGFNQLSGALPEAPRSLAATYSSVCPNRFAAIDSTGWNAATGDRPWYRDCVSDAAADVNPDQRGLTGTWYNPATTGQGLVFTSEPDLIRPGRGILFGGWYTYDVAPSGGAEKQRWYTLQGYTKLGYRSARLSILQTTGGTFAVPPRISASIVGTATISFGDCGHGTLNYRFYYGGPQGSIPLARLSAQTTCVPEGDDGSAPARALLSGAWYEPATSGQGLVLEVSPGSNALFAGWYTFAPSGSTTSEPRQRWYTLQAPLPSGASSPLFLDNVGIYAATGGVFDYPLRPTTTRVGTAKVAFDSCSNGKLVYAFTEGTNAGLSGAIPLTRLGPVPPGCAP